ncbi:MAG: biotin/lipoyl-binding protein [Planctomycetes bacterium]|nr:biotin/lipoyl-binding protein [Planctomycetota bacterium]
MPYIVRANDREYLVDVEIKPGETVVSVGGETLKVTLDAGKRGVRNAIIDQKRVSFAHKKTSSKTYEITLGGVTTEVEIEDEILARFAKARAEISGGTRDVSVRAPMPGMILKVHVKPGQTVKKNDPLVVLHAMKLENSIASPSAGTVTEVLVSANESVEKGALLVKISGG